MKTTITKRIPYSEWITNPFPQLGPLKLDQTFRYIVIDCPSEYIDELKAQGLEVEAAKQPETITITSSVKQTSKKEKTKKEVYDRKEVIEVVKYYCELQRLACQMPLASLEISGKVTKQEIDRICKLIRDDADIFNIRNLEEEI